MSFKRFIAGQIGKWIVAYADQAQHLYDRVCEHRSFEAGVRPPMSAICIRSRGDGEMTEEELSRLHAEVARRVEQSGRFWISTTELKGKAWFRINPVNFRTRREHMDGLLQLLETECQALVTQGRG